MAVAGRGTMCGARHENLAFDELRQVPRAPVVADCRGLFSRVPEEI
jgi:hypothetical protein